MSRSLQHAWRDEDDRRLLGFVGVVRPKLYANVNWRIAPDLEDGRLHRRTQAPGNKDRGTDSQLICHDLTRDRLRTWC